MDGIDVLKIQLKNFFKNTKLCPKKVERGQRETEKKNNNKRQSKHTIDVNKAISWYLETSNKMEYSIENEKLKCTDKQRRD